MSKLWRQREAIEMQVDLVSADCDMPERPEELKARINELFDRLESSQTEAERLSDLINNPELHDFAKGVVLESAHQREKWSTDHDVGKTAADWFWLIGYLAQKAMYYYLAGDTDKALHHCITTAAAMANWHAAISGESNLMRPGIGSDKEASL